MEKIIDQDWGNVSCKYLVINILSLLSLRKISKLEGKRKSLRGKMYRL